MLLDLSDQEANNDVKDYLYENPDFVIVPVVKNQSQATNF